MTLWQVVAGASLSGLLVGALAYVLPPPVLMALNAAVAGLTAGWLFTRHNDRVALGLLRAMSASAGVIVWCGERQRDGHWELLWAAGRQLHHWRPGQSLYESKPTDVGPCSRQLSTWPDPSGLRDETCDRALFEGTELAYATVTDPQVAGADGVPDVWTSSVVPIGHRRVVVIAQDARPAVGDVSRWLGQQAARRLVGMMHAAG